MKKKIIAIAVAGVIVAVSSIFIGAAATNGGIMDDWFEERGTSPESEYEKMLAEYEARLKEAKTEEEREKIQSLIDTLKELHAEWQETNS